MEDEDYTCVKPKISIGTWRRWYIALTSVVAGVVYFLSAPENLLSHITLVFALGALAYVLSPARTFEYYRDSGVRLIGDTVVPYGRFAEKVRGPVKLSDIKKIKTISHRGITGCYIKGEFGNIYIEGIPRMAEFLENLQKRRPDLPIIRNPFW